MRIFACFTLALLTLASACFAQETKPEKPLAERLPYKTAGLPTKPKVPAAFNRYHDYTESSKLFADLAAAYPEYAKLQSVGKTYGNRDMWVLTITDFSVGEETQKPGMWIDGAIHANEIQATEVVLYTAWYLLEHRAENEMVQRLLKERVFYLCPMMSPDSRDAHFYEPNTTHSPRTGQRPRDDDQDGRVDEDDAEDINGDGHITTMRIRDKNGTFKPHPEFPHLLIPAKPGEKGEFRLLGEEGQDSDGDGRVNEDGDGFYDPNRDWGWNWQPGYIQNGANRYPLSILENRHIADFIVTRPNIVGAQSYHNAGGMILRGPGAKDDAFEAGDLLVYDELGKKGEKMLPGYRYMNIANDLYEVYGGEVDWLHQVRGAFTFTNELFTAFNYYRQPGEHGGYFGTPELQAEFNRYLLMEEGIVPWKEYDHPQFGKVEIGGFKKNWVRQPPSFLLEEECHRNMAFTLLHADELPLVKVQGVSSKSLGENVWEVTAIIENPKTVPTHSITDVKRKITPPDTIAITPADAGAKVVVGLLDSEPFFRSPTEQKKKPEKLKVPTIGTRGLVYARWIVTGSGKVTVSVTSVKGGRSSLEVELGK